MVEFKHSFSKDYWKSAFSEVKRVFSLIVCALFCALRIAVKSLRIYIAPSLYISFDFIVNSVGAMIYGPVLGALSGLVSDTVGYIIAPSGPYFFPFAFVEMTSAFIFGLFLYRKKLSAQRIVLSRFAVIVVCNLIMNPIIMYWSSVWSGTEASYVFFTTARLIKNVALYPFECLVMTLVLPAVSVPLARMGYVPYSGRKIKFGWREIVILALLSLLAVAFVVLYIMYKNGAFN